MKFVKEEAKNERKEALQTEVADEKEERRTKKKKKASVKRLCRRRLKKKNKLYDRKGFRKKEFN
jgi:hypothetical protein